MVYTHTLKDIQYYDSLDLIAKQVVEGFIVGLHKSPLHGFSVEFAEHRLYNPGEDIKHIDWKVFGRTDRLYVKRYEEETNLRCQLVIDASSSMYYPEAEGAGNKVPRNKLSFSVYAAAALMHILYKQRDAFGLSVFADHLKEHTPAKSTVAHQQFILGLLEQMLQQPRDHETTSAADCLHRISESLHKRSLVVIFSDMFDSPGPEGEERTDELFAALQHLRHNKHEVVLFHVTDKAKELDFAFQNRPYRFVDVETGEKVKLQAHQVRDYYTRQVQAFTKALKLRCAQYRIDFVPADINQPFRQILVPYLVKRSRLY